MPSQVVRVDGLRSIASSTITGTYAPLGTSFGHPMRLVKIVNNSTMDVTVSFDGINDNDYVPTGSFTLYDLTTNKVLPDTTFVFQNGTQVYVKGTAGTGNVYLTCIFGQGD